MGYTLANALATNQAKIILISGPTSQKIDYQNVQLVSVTTAEEMFDASIKYFPECDGAILAAAVADYRPVKSRKQ